MKCKHLPKYDSLCDTCYEKTQKCESCKVWLTEFIWKVDGRWWCQSCFWKLMEDMDRNDSSRD